MNKNSPSVKAINLGKHNLIESGELKILLDGRFDNGVRYSVATDLDAPGGKEIKRFKRDDSFQTIEFTDGSSIGTDAQRNKHLTQTDGRQIIVNPSGETTIVFKDGTRMIRNGGATKLVYADGSERHFQNVNGKSVLSRDPQVGPAVKDADGTVAYFVGGAEVAGPSDLVMSH